MDKTGARIGTVKIGINTTAGVKGRRARAKSSELVELLTGFEKTTIMLINPFVIQIFYVNFINLFLFI